jgi:hypothetical protein
MSSGDNRYPRVHDHEVIQRTLAMKTFRVILMSSLSAQDRQAYRFGVEQVHFYRNHSLLRHLHSRTMTRPPNPSPSKTFDGTAGLDTPMPI